ncbi:MAG TPA: hypothetical protein VHM67_05530 [Gemmatimonadaceae bacterium]|nr:hypothetical protein [Gemmatimonadaceae bacterium]
MPIRNAAAVVAVLLAGALPAQAQVVVGTPRQTAPPASAPGVPATPAARAAAGVQGSRDRVVIVRKGAEVDFNQVSESIAAHSAEIAAAQAKFQAKLHELDKLEHLPERIRVQVEQAQSRGEMARARAEAARERAEANADMQREMIEIAGDRHRLTTLVKRLGSDPQGIRMPPIDSISTEPVTVAADTKRGRVAAVGLLDVFGTVDGDAVVLGGDIVVHEGGQITGDALAVGGTVRLEGGTVEGEMRSIDRALVPHATPTTSGFRTLIDRLQRTMAFLIVMVLLGFATLVFAEERLRNVTSAIEGRYGKSLLIGLVSEVSFIPLLIIVPVLLVVTIIGILVVPFAIAAIVVGMAALLVLGFLAVSRVAGQALTKRSAPASVRGAELRAMLAGLFFFAALWLAGGLLGWVPILGTLINALALVVTWAAATVGLGAAVITRGGKRPRVPPTPPDFTPEIGWQTPTPISGVAAARGPITSGTEV